MPLQHSLDGTIKLVVPVSTNDIDAVMENGAPRHGQYAQQIEPDSYREQAWRVMFSIISAHTPMDKAVRTYRRLRDAGEVVWPYCTPAFDGVMAPVKKARYCAAAWERMIEWGEFIQTREELLSVKGLGLAKATFAAALFDPVRADVACIDTHMYRLATGEVARSSVRPKEYFRIEESVRQIARRHGVGTFVTQWTLWSAMRGVEDDHSFLVGA